MAKHGSPSENTNDQQMLPKRRKTSELSNIMPISNAGESGAEDSEAVSDPEDGGTGSVHTTVATDGNSAADLADMEIHSDLTGENGDFDEDGDLYEASFESIVASGNQMDNTSNSDDDLAGIAPEEQARIVRQAAAAKMEHGQTWYLVCAKWWQAWKDYVSYDGPPCSDTWLHPHPGSITNSVLLDERGELLPARLENVDFVLVPEAAWKRLHRWYGGPEIGRPVVKQVHHCKLQLHKRTIKVRHNQSTLHFTMSKSDTYGELRQSVALECNLDLEGLTFGDPTASLKWSDDTTLQEMGLQHGHVLHVNSAPDGQTSDMSIVCDLRGTSSAGRLGDHEGAMQPALVQVTSSPTDDDEDNLSDGLPSLAPHAPKDDPDDWAALSDQSGLGDGGGSSPARILPSPPADRPNGHSYGHRGVQYRDGKPGAVGLDNLGNTCFMNSALQCLAHTVPLVDCMRNGEYSVNETNPLGTRGELVEEFVRLLSQIWSGESSSVSPREFKFTLGKHAEQFMGYDQHDSQELTAYLLDGIHEDTNRVTEKPFVEKVEAQPGQDDASAAARAWEAHLLRNDSPIVDFFQGQLKSVVTCPHCPKVSTTFDPFMYLSLPLPDHMRTFEVIFVPLGGPPVRYTLPVRRLGEVRDLRVAVSARCGVPLEDLTMEDIFQHMRWQHTELSDSKPLDQVNGRDSLYAYQLRPLPAPPTTIPPEVPDEDGPQQSLWLRTLTPFIRNLSSWPTQRELETQLGSGVITDCLKEALQVRKILRLAMLARDPPESIDVGKIGVLFRTPLRTADEQRIISGVQQLRSAVLEPYGWRVLEVAHTTSPSVGFTNKFCHPLMIRIHWASYTLRDLFADIAQLIQPMLASQSQADDSDSPPETAEVLLASGRISLYLSRFESFNAARHMLSIKLPCPSAGGQRDPLEEQDADSRLLADLAPPELNLTKVLILAQWDTDTQRRLYDASYENPLGEDLGAGGPEVTVTQALSNFLKREQLEDSEMWYCSGCKQHRRAYKELALWRLPPVLVVHLKRFSSVNSWRRDKIDSLVSFPVKGLDLTPYLVSGGGSSEQAEPAIYDLYAISNHFGGLGGGHYTAHALNHLDSQWYHFDDWRVSRVDDPSTLVTAAAYILFYLRRPTAVASLQCNSPLEGSVAAV